MPRKPTERQLAEYRAKRDFSATAEPAPHEVGEPEFDSRGPLTFMVHKHSATRLHYDIRLELDGVLVCWAVPKGPSANPQEKRLAVHVEDHPFDYGGYEGVIPKGNYGAGPSLMWDTGTFSPDEGGPTYWDDRAGAEAELRSEIANGKVSVTFRGTKLKGSYAFIHTKKATNEWLLIKHKDEAVRTTGDILDLDRSVASGMTVDELRRSGITGAERRDRSYSPALLDGAKAGELVTIEPMLASAASIPVRHEGWSFEPKLDGIRALASISPGSPEAKVSMRSRGGNDISGKYPALRAALARQPVGTCLLDGEIVAIGADGRPSFELLQQRMNLQDARQIAQMDADVPVVYFVFDIVHLDGYDLSGSPLWQRRELLERVVLPSPRISTVATIDAAPDEAFRMSVAAGFEGIVAKRDSSRYEAGRRSAAWIKKKSLDSETFTVCGFMPGNGARASSFGGLLLGRKGADGKWEYCGRVGSGFSDKQVDRFAGELRRLKTNHGPFVTAPPESVGAVWVKPEMEVVVEHAGFTTAGVLRTPIFKGLAGEIVPSAGIATAANHAPQRDEADAEVLAQLLQPRQNLTLEGKGWSLPVTNLDKALWPTTERREAVTKRELLRYAVAIAAKAIFHLRDRPLTLRRFPNGILAKPFYQKHYEQDPPAFVQTVDVFGEGEGVDRRWLLCNNLPTLLWLCQLADIEWHASLARVSPSADTAGIGTVFTGSSDNLDASLLSHPDFMLFDFDPYIYAGTEGRGEEPEPNRAGFEASCRVAFALKELIEPLGLTPFVKTSGATGLHVYVPILRQLDYATIRAAVNTICAELAARRPKEVTMEWATDRRRGKVFLDANQNARHKVLAAPYSPRAKPGAPVSLPLEWVDLGKVYPGDVSLLDPWWVAQPDPWARIFEEKHDLAKILGLAT